MAAETFAQMECSVARTLAVVGERWTLLIVRDAFNGVRRFDDFLDSLGIARNILADRLQRLVEDGVLERRRYQEHPERFEYRLTEKGRDLYPLLIAMQRWGDRYQAGAAGPALAITHRDCGHELDVSVRCPRCDTAVTPRDVRVDRGPGFRDDVPDVALPLWARKLRESAD